MLVFGDVERTEQPAAMAASIRERLREAAALPPGLGHHAALTAAFIAAGELVQGLVDRDFLVSGADALSPAQAAGGRLLLLLAQALDRSWTSGFAGQLAPNVTALLDEIGRGGPIRARHAEGFAIYALYPETYLDAARSSGLGPDTRVIGVRSIGTSLAALVAAALGAGPAWTVRPVGHPFHRELRIAPDLAAALLSGGEDKDYAVVDEGPGLSGSSFAAVARWLEANGVAPGRIHFFPSHGNEPGPQASPAAAARWRLSPRHHAGFESVILRAQNPAHRLDTWVSGLLGRLDGPLEDISGGAWRDLGGSDSAAPSDRPMERRKYLACAGGTCWLVKFAGLGAEGVRKLGNARALASAGLVPEPAGLVHGFLVERWVEGPPLPAAPHLARNLLVAGLARYLAARAALLAPANGGAPLSALFAMTRHNAALALGEAVAARIEARLGPAEALEAQVRRVDTDNRLHAWEWRVPAEGRLLKTDALDHSAAHDMIGCQDLAWDVAGAAVEHALSDAEATELCRVLGRSGAAVHPELAEALLPCYLAFQLGLWTMAAERADPDGRERLVGLADRYARRLTDWLDGGGLFGRPAP